MIDFKVERMKRRISQQDLADALNVSIHTIVRMEAYERTHKNPFYTMRAANVARIAEFFGVSADELLEIGEYKPKSK